MNTAQRVELLLVILSNLRRYHVVSVAELAQQLNMNEGDLSAELETLLYVGVPPFGGGDMLPIELDEEGYLCATGDMPALGKSLRLTEEEAQAFILSLRIAGFQSDDTLVRKLTDAVTRGFDVNTLEQIVLVCQASHDTGIFQVLSQALDAGQAVTLKYRNLKGEDSTRVVEPRSLFTEGDVWYLNGFDHKSGQARNFRVDQVAEVKIAQTAETGRTGRTPSGISEACADEPAFALDVDRLPYNCRIRFLRPEAFRAPEWPGAVQRPGHAAAVEVDVPYGDSAWVARRVMALHGQAEVLFPDEVRVAVRAAAETELARLRARQK